MSALPQDDLPPRPRAMRFARPVEDAYPEGVAPPARERVRVRYSPDSPEVPVPPALERYVRGPVHFAAVLRALTAHAGGESRQGYDLARLECAQDILRRFMRDLNDRDACDLLLLLFPRVPCGVCGKTYLKEGARREYCSDSCRRKAAIAAADARSAVRS